MHLIYGDDFDIGFKISENFITISLRDVLITLLYGSSHVVDNCRFDDEADPNLVLLGISYLTHQIDKTHLLITHLTYKSLKFLTIATAVTSDAVATRIRDFALQFPMASINWWNGGIVVMPRVTKYMLFNNNICLVRECHLVV